MDLDHANAEFLTVKLTTEFWCNSWSKVRNNNSVLCQKIYSSQWLSLYSCYLTWVFPQNEIVTTARHHINNRRDIYRNLENMNSLICVPVVLIQSIEYYSLRLHKHFLNFFIREIWVTPTIKTLNPLSSFVPLSSYIEHTKQKNKQKKNESIIVTPTLV